VQMKTFKQAFNTVFHDEALFDFLCHGDLSSELTTFQVGKAQRDVIKVSDKLKSLLRFIDKVVLSHLDINQSVVHSYIKNKSVVTAAEQHVNSQCFLVTDIQKFFSNITEDHVEEILRSNIKNIPISDFENYIPRLLKLTCINGCLPVGYVTSPKLSNAALRKFDSVLEEHCKEHKLIYTRYSDDLIISGNEHETLKDVSLEIQKFLTENCHSELRINQKKTRIYKLGQSFTILGLVITQYGTLALGKKYKNHLELCLHYYLNDQQLFEQYLEQHFGGKIRSLFGMFHYAKSIDPKYIEKLQRKYGAFAIASLLENKWNG